MNIHKLITKLTSPYLCQASRKSVKEVSRLKNELVFQSKTMKELFTDAYEYKGAEKGIIYLKDKLSRKPTPVRVEVVQNPFMGNKNHVVENVYLVNPTNNLVIADKNYDIKILENGKKIMYQGSMSTYDPNFIGAGIRMDQIQIARALELGIDSIPRSSYPQSIIYHIKMGFLPLENIEPMRSLSSIKKYIKSNYKDNNYTKLPIKYFRPIVVQKDNKFYLDKSWMLVRAWVVKCKEVLAKTQKTRVRGYDTFTIGLKLTGNELNTWKNLLKDFPILDKLKPIKDRLV